MSSLEETRLAEDLRLLAASPTDPPDLDGIERRGAQRRRRGHAIRGLAALTGLATTLGIGLAVLGTGLSQAPAETVAYVTQRITTALSVNNLVVKTVSGSSSAGPVTYWTDLRTGDTMGSQGHGAARITYWLQKSLDRRQQVLDTKLTQVNYYSRTWWTTAQQLAVPPHGGVDAQGAGQVTTFTPQDIKLLLKHAATIVGHGYVNGHHTVELSVFPGPGPKILLWADASTYQVVRMVQDFPASMHMKPIVASFTWAARSAALIQQVDHPHIPAGFRQVPPGG